MTFAARRLIPVVIYSFCGALAAQAPEPTGASAPQDRPPPRASAAPTRQIYVSALDGRGVPVSGLTAADFLVREDGTAREVLDARIADTPLHIALLIDDSQNASEATMYLRDGLAAMFERLRGKAQIALITIGERPTILSQYTDDTEQLKKQTGRLFPRPGSGAYLLDAIFDASRGLAKRETERPVIAAITFEGVDYSNQQYERVLEELRKSGAALHVVAVGSPSSSLSDEARNRNIVIGEGTSRTGGRRDQVLSLNGLPDKLKQVADELVNQYVVTYARPEKLIPPEKIQVSTTRPNVTVRARTWLTQR
jgi:VWFA-related protein